MIINHNIAALNTHRQLGANTAASSKNLEKLSSGLRINRAGDDAAGLAISEKMRGQIRGLDMASKNAQDGISLIQTAEGALTETHSILQRMRELAVQSSTDTNTDNDRANLQKEVDQLAQELTRIGRDTEFNTKKLLDGTFSGTFHIGANEGQNISLSVDDLRGFNLGVTGSAKFEITVDITIDDPANPEFADGTYKIDGTDLKDAEGKVVATTADGGLTWKTANDTIDFGQKIKEGTITIKDGKATGKTEFNNNGLQAGDYIIKEDGGKATIQDTNGNVIAKSENATEFKSLDGKTTIFTLDKKMATDAELTFTVGGTDISSASTANKAITTINTALETVSTERSKLGAYQNRLEHTVNNLGASSENLSAAESRIRDVDMAKEMVQFTKNNILTQAAQAMLAQANQQPQGVLQLLR